MLETRSLATSEIVWVSGHYAVQDHLRSLTDFGTNWKPVYDFLLVNNTNYVF